MTIDKPSGARVKWMRLRLKQQNSTVKKDKAVRLKHTGQYTQQTSEKRPFESAYLRLQVYQSPR